jgi:hypothetical protein
MSQKSTELFENQLTWSGARFATLQRCEKRYYYQFIGSWGGWDIAAPAETQKAYRLKYLTNPYLEIGNLIHDRIRSIFERALVGRRIPIEDEIKIAKGNFQLFLHYSRLKYLEQVTRQGRKLLQDQLGLPVSDYEEAGYLSSIERLLRNFWELEDVSEILKTPEILIPEFLDPRGFELGKELGVPSRLRTDAVWLVGEKLVIGDWKCGKPNDNHRNQGLAYDIFIRRRLGLAANESVEVRFYYLGTGEVTSYAFTPEDRDLFMWQVGEEFETLRSYSDDPVLNIGSPSRFFARISPACQACPFQLTCPEFIKSNTAKICEREVA